MIGSYPSIYAIGHRQILGIFDGPVLIEEKVDGSQFSFGLLGGELHCRSKGQQVLIDAPDKLFAAAVATVKDIAPKLGRDWIYRAEYLSKPKHNTLTYGRIPDRHLALFDIEIGTQCFAGAEQKAQEAARLGIDVVPVLHHGTVSDFTQLQGFLERESFLGGAKVEGFVVKNYERFTDEKKIAIGKYVSEKFKEIHRESWRKANPTKGDILAEVIGAYRTDARWRKSIEHLRDLGQIEDSPRDIGKLILEVQADVEKECAAEIREVLYAHFWPQIRRGLIAGFPEFYKARLAASAFDAPLSQGDSQ